MSYARFGEDSDVYAYTSSRHHVCCACRLNEPRRVYSQAYETEFNLRDDAVFETLEELFDHLEAHVSAGHKVPEYAFKELTLHT